MNAHSEDRLNDIIEERKELLTRLAEPVGTDQLWLCGNCGHAFNTVPNRRDTQELLGELGISTDYRNRTAFHGGFRPNTSMLAGHEHQDRIEAGEAAGRAIEPAVRTGNSTGPHLRFTWPSEASLARDRSPWDLVADAVYVPEDDEESDDEGNIVRGENA